MDSIEKLVRFYNKSDENDMYHNVVGCVLKNLDQVNRVSIYDMADLCYSSASTISRLVKMMGFKSYPDFKARIHYALENYRELNRNMPNASLMRDSDIVSVYLQFLKEKITALEESLDYEKIAEISDSFHEADEIFLYSYPQVQIHALQKALILSGKNTHYYNGIAQAERNLAGVKKDSVVFAVIPNLIEMSPYRRLLKKASEQGAKVISVCSAESNQYKKHSDIQISYTGTQTSMDLYLFMVITNIILDDYGRRYLEARLEEL